MNHIDKLWESYSKTLPKDLPYELKGEAKLGFKCGCIALFGLMMEKAIDDSIEECEGEKFLSDLQEECMDIASQISLAIINARAQKKAEKCA